jgi:hypothetical protein
MRLLCVFLCCAAFALDDDALLPVCDMLDDRQRHNDGQWVDVADAAPLEWRACDSTRLYNAFQMNLECHFRGADPLRLVWKPRLCRLLPFDATAFFVRLDGHRLDLVGDSISTQMYVNLQCALEQAGVLDLNYTYNRLSPLRARPELAAVDPVTGVETVHTSFLYELRDGALDYDRPERWYHNDRKRILVINTGAWFNRNKVHTLGITDVRPHQVEQWFERTIKHMLDVTLANFHGVVIFRSISPAHEDCGVALPAADVGAFAWEQFRRRNEFVRQELRGRARTYYLDIEPLSEGRSDGHPGSLGLSHDCFHWCNPGPTSVLNTWTDALFTMITQLRAAGVLDRPE